MSLAVAALRIATVKALTGATSAGARVFDSKVDPVSLLGRDAEPTIVVYADTGRRRIQGRAAFAAEHVVDLTVEMFRARATMVSAGSDDERIEVEIPGNDAGNENYLRVLAWEVERALLHGADGWADLWRALVYRAAVGEVSDWDRGADAEKGARFAFLRSVLRLEVASDPVPGAPLTPLWTRVIEAMEADGELGSFGLFLRQLTTSPAVPAWRQAQAVLGLTDAGIRATGLAPFIGAEDPENEGDAPAASDLSFSDDVHHDVIAVTEDGATLTLPDEAPVPLVETPSDD